MNGYKIEPSQVLITFDDGYKNILTELTPFLRSLNVPFSVFISTKHIDESIRFPMYYLRAGIFHTERKYIDIISLNKKLDLSSVKKRNEVKNSLGKYLKMSDQNLKNSIASQTRR